jgi:hypothetical protein
MKVLMTLVLVLLLAGCAAGQGDSAGSTTTEEETATHSAREETTVLKVEGNLRRPPDSTLSYGGREVKGTLGAYCWSYGNTSGCVQMAWPLIPSKRKTLTVPSGSEMVFRYGGQSPPKMGELAAYPLNKQKTGLMRPDRSLKAHGSGVQRTIPAELPPGEYVLEVLIKERQGDASYYFRIMVE